MTLLKKDRVAALVREMISDGTLKPGGAVPPYAALARATGFSVLTCRAGLRPLVEDGTLVQGPSKTARLRVAQHRPGRDAALRDALARTLGGLRADKEMTQSALAGLLGVSVTTVGHAETARGRVSRGFWERADQVLGGGGGLPRLYDACQAAVHAPGPGAPPAAVPARPVKAAALAAAGVVIAWPGGARARPPGGPG